MSGQARAAAAPGFEYGQSGANWEGLAQTGKEQSPIDLNDFPEDQEEVHILSSAHARYHPLHLHYPINSSYDLDPDMNTFKLTGLQGGFEAVTIDSSDGTPSQFQVRNLHFHAPSEHSVNHHLLDLEMHIVHTTEDMRLGVLGVLFHESAHRSPLLDAIIHRRALDLNAQLGTVIDNFYFYKGSLTTPPCTEGVNWFVLRYGDGIALPATPDQLKFFTSKWADNQAFASGRGNNRVVQPTGCRTLYKMVAHPKH